ncbi:hypothetical protein AB836_01950 [Rickettsiales bacterium (ex Bugula neritina AB1)]|nr:hypothetical protein AB836_01950 [Rickettsiales bacterium (ex Bugula neritina AB1)]
MVLSFYLFIFFINVNGNLLKKNIEELYTTKIPEEKKLLFLQEFLYNLKNFYGKKDDIFQLIENFIINKENIEIFIDNITFKYKEPYKEDGTTENNIIYTTQNIIDMNFINQDDMIYIISLCEKIFNKTQNYNRNIMLFYLINNPLMNIFTKDLINYDCRDDYIYYFYNDIDVNKIKFIFLSFLSEIQHSENYYEIWKNIKILKNLFLFYFNKENMKQKETKKKQDNDLDNEEDNDVDNINIFNLFLFNCICIYMDNLEDEVNNTILKIRFYESLEVFYLLLSLILFLTLTLTLINNINNIVNIVNKYDMSNIINNIYIDYFSMYYNSISDYIPDYILDYMIPITIMIFIRIFIYSILISIFKITKKVLPVLIENIIKFFCLYNDKRITAFYNGIGKMFYELFFHIGNLFNKIIYYILPKAVIKFLNFINFIINWIFIFRWFLKKPIMKFITKMKNCINNYYNNKFKNLFLIIRTNNININNNNGINILYALISEFKLDNNKKYYNYYFEIVFSHFIRHLIEKSENEYLKNFLNDLKKKNDEKNTLYHSYHNVLFDIINIIFFEESNNFSQYIDNTKKNDKILFCNYDKFIINIFKEFINYIRKEEKYIFSNSLIISIFFTRTYIMLSNDQAKLEFLNILKNEENKKLQEFIFNALTQYSSSDMMKNINGFIDSDEHQSMDEFLDNLYIEKDVFTNEKKQEQLEKKFQNAKKQQDIFNEVYEKDLQEITNLQNQVNDIYKITKIKRSILRILIIIIMITIGINLKKIILYVISFIKKIKKKINLRKYNKFSNITKI